jgi:hypothetical protein
MATMEGKPDERSQPLLRVPRDKTPAELTLDDGERTYVLLYIAPGDRISRLFVDSTPFVPTTNGAGTRFVARAAIACITVHETRGGDDTELWAEWQRTTVKLRSGTTIVGELRWTGPLGRRRTQDHLNDSQPYIRLFDGDYVHYIAKSAVVALEES